MDPSDKNNELPWGSGAPPISFRYGADSGPQPYREWKHTDTGDEVGPASAREIAYHDPATQLKVTVRVRSFDAPPAWDWVVECENCGDAATPIIKDILPLDLSSPAAPEEKVQLNYSKGSLRRPDDFLPISEDLPTENTRRLRPVGGRSSNGVLPFVNLQQGDRGVVLAIGWSGQWFIEIERGRETLHIRAGMERTHLRLHSGEKIRTPRILLIPWEGDDPIRGNNLLRRLLLAHYAPRIDGEAVLPPVCHMTMSTFHHAKTVSEEGEMDAISRADELGVEAYWLDACWYGSGGEWWEEVGNWTVNARDFPRGLRPLGDAAHRKGMKFVLWFEPERVGNGTALEREHGEFLLRSEHDADNHLLHLGLPAARAHVTELMSRIISEAGVDVYRQDFNLDPLPYWQAADSEDRVGISEIRHIEGLYLMWDELRQRHPGLLIDNCSSGGRRIDLETVSRSFPLWRSDFSDIGGPAHGRNLQIADQIQTSGLSRWVPLHAGAVWTFTPYDFRSAIAAGIVPYSDIRVGNFPRHAAKRAIRELKSLRPYFLGDFYPLLPLTTAAHDWCAYQYHGPELGGGFAVFLRRHRSPFPNMKANLQGIIPEARYEMSLAYDYQASPVEHVRGDELAGMTISIPDVPGSVLLRYQEQD